MLLIEFLLSSGRSERGRECRPNCVRSVFTTYRGQDSHVLIDQAWCSFMVEPDSFTFLKAALGNWFVYNHSYFASVGIWIKTEESRSEESQRKVELTEKYVFNFSSYWLRKFRIGVQSALSLLSSIYYVCAWKNFSILYLAGVSLSDENANLSKFACSFDSRF